MDLKPYIKAGYPILYLLTPEEGRAELMIVKIAKELKRKLFGWSHTDGLFDYVGKYSDQALSDPLKAIAKISSEYDAEGGDNHIFVMRDFHKFLKLPKVARYVRDIANRFKQIGHTLIILAPENDIPKDIERDITLIEFQLPNKEEIGEVWDNLYGTQKKAIGEVDADARERVVDAAMGLTTIEAENAFAKALVVMKDKSMIPKLVMSEKAQAVKKSGILEYFEPTETIKDVGGLGNLKLFYQKRGKAYTKKAREFGLPMPRGIVLVGLPGCGKSLSAKAASNIMGVPLLRFDIGRCFGSHVGQSELNMRTAINTVEAVGTCVLWLDEMEKAFAGAGGGGDNDSGVTDRVFGTFLTWMQEKKAPAFVVATVNRIDGILAKTPELLRKGRFDEIFFVGLPSVQERKDIFSIHINRFGRDAEKMNVDLLAKESKEFSGAEIEETVITAMYDAFYKDSDLTAAYLSNAIKNTNPMAKSAAEQMKNMAKWAAANAVPASICKEDESTGVSFQRKIDLG